MPKPDLPPSSHEEQLEQPLIFRLAIAFLLVGQVIWRLLGGKFSGRKVLEQMIQAGPASLLPVLLVGGFGGMIFTIQMARELTIFGAEQMVGGAFAIAFCRELAPILTASIVAGQVGSAFAAELGAMQVSEQIDALYMLRSNPIDYLVVPRVIACCFMMPLLIFFALVVGIGGGLGVSMYFYHMGAIQFLNSVRSFLTLDDVISMGLKGIVFGLMIAVIGCSWGLTTRGGARQVGQAATSAVVTTWISIFISDFLISVLIFHQSPLP